MKPSAYTFVVAIVFGLASFSAYNVGEVEVGAVLLAFASCGLGSWSLTRLSVFGNG